MSLVHPLDRARVSRAAGQAYYRKVPSPSIFRPEDLELKSDDLPAMVERSNGVNLSTLHIDDDSQESEMHWRNLFINRA